MSTVTSDRTLLIAIVSVGLSIIGLMFHQTSTISGRIDRLEQRINRRFDEANKRFDARFNQVDTRFDRVEARFERLEEHVFELPPLKRKH